VPVFSSLTLAVKEALRTFEGDVLPASHTFGPQLGMPGDFERAIHAGEDFEDDMSLELWDEISSATLGHRSALPESEYRLRYWSNPKGAPNGLVSQVRSAGFTIVEQCTLRDGPGQLPADMLDLYPEDNLQHIM
jgi:hypothetical protein